MSRRLKEKFLVLAAFVTCGCSASNESTVTGGVALDALEAELIGAVCNAYVVCGLMPDRATCLVSVNIQHPSITLDNGLETLLGPLTTFFPTMKADVAAGIVKYDPKAAQACIAAFSDLRSCERTELVGALDRAKKSCNVMFSGTLALGDTCYFDEECGSQERCFAGITCESEGCRPGTCLAAFQVIPAGGDCSHRSPPDLDCAEGTLCAGYPEMRCTPLLSLGASCQSTGTCQAPYFCKSPDGVCAVPAARGETCGGLPEASPYCSDGRDTCVMNTDLCTARIPVGDACTGTFGDAECVAYAVCSGSICVALHGGGESCAAGLPCLYPLTCDATSHCALPPTRASCR